MKNYNLVLIYRNNDLYNNHLPRLIELFPAHVHVQTLAFPRETSIEEMRGPITEFLNQLDRYEGVCLTDETCYPALKNLQEEMNHIFGSPRDSETTSFLNFQTWTLDRIFRTALVSSLKTVNFSDTFGALLPLITKKNIDNIYIVEDKLTDHCGYLEIPLAVFREELVNAVQKKCPESKIIFLDNHTAVEAFKSSDLLIIDRHVCKTEDIQVFSGSTFWLPFESALMEDVSLQDTFLNPKSLLYVLADSEFNILQNSNRRKDNNKAQTHWEIPIKGIDKTQEVTFP